MSMHFDHTILKQGDGGAVMSNTLEPGEKLLNGLSYEDIQGGLVEPSSKPAKKAAKTNKQKIAEQKRDEPKVEEAPAEEPAQIPDKAEQENNESNPDAPTTPAAPVEQTPADAEAAAQ